MSFVDAIFDTSDLILNLANSTWGIILELIWKKWMKMNEKWWLDEWLGVIISSEIKNKPEKRADLMDYW